MLHLSILDAGTLAVLRQISKIPLIERQFALAGGTSLALQTGHRKSIDLDFFSEKVFLPTDLENLLAGNTSWRYEPSGAGERMLFCFINGIKCDFVNEPFPLIESFLEVDGIKLYSIADIAAMKMHAICGRGKKKDFFDIYVLLQLYSWQQMLKWFELKYGSSQLFFLWKSITYFSDAEDEVDIRGLEPYSASWQEIKEKIIRECR